MGIFFKIGFLNPDESQLDKSLLVGRWVEGHWVLYEKLPPEEQGDDGVTKVTLVAVDDHLFRLFFEKLVLDDDLKIDVVESKSFHSDFVAVFYLSLFLKRAISFLICLRAREVLANSVHFRLGLDNSPVIMRTMSPL